MCVVMTQTFETRQIEHSSLIALMKQTNILMKINFEYMECFTFSIFIVVVEFGCIQHNNNGDDGEHYGYSLDSYCAN